MEESTFILIKPDGVKRRLVGEIISRIEKKGYVLERISMQRPSEDVFLRHYEEHKNKDFFPGFLRYMKSGNVVAMVWSGKGVVRGCRKLIGETDPKDACIGTIRGDFGIDTGRNLVHGSDSKESAVREIKIWFGDLPKISHSHDHELIYE